MSKHTKGPWFSDGEGNVWRRPPKDLYENGGRVAGDKPLATAHVGWYHEGAVGYPVEANARLIAAAPDHHDVAVELDRMSLVIESAIRQADPTRHADVLALLKANRSAIAKAEGKQ